MASLSKLARRGRGPTVSAEEHAALKRRVAKLSKTVEELVVREARLAEELTLLRRETIAARDASTDR